MLLQLFVDRSVFTPHLSICLPSDILDTETYIELLHFAEIDP